MRLWTVVKQEWLVIVLGAGGVLGLVLVLAKCEDPWATHRFDKAKVADVQLVNGDPIYNTVVVYHDNNRGVTCYVDSTHGGITCFLDITLEDQKRMLAYRDAGFP